GRGRDGGPGKPPGGGLPGPPSGPRAVGRIPDVGQVSVRYMRSVSWVVNPRRSYTDTAALLSASTYSIAVGRPRSARCRRPTVVRYLPSPPPCASGPTPTTYTSPRPSSRCSLVQWKPTSRPSRSAGKKPSGSNHGSALR